MPQRPSLNLLLVTNLYPPQALGGYGRLMADFAELLRQRGHRVRVLTSNTDYLAPRPGPHSEPEVERSLQLFGGWGKGGTWSLPRDQALTCIRANYQLLCQRIEQIKPDACLLGDIETLSMMLLHAFLERGIPVLHHCGNSTPGYPPTDTPASALYHAATCSQWLLDQYHAKGYRFADASVVYPGARVADFYDPIPLRTDCLRIAYASILMPYKGPDMLFDALLLLAQQGVDFRCRFAGQCHDPAYQQQMQSRIDAAGLQDQVQLLGPLKRDALQRLYADSNVLVFPSRFDEPFGISQVEAMAAGRLVISTATGGAAEIVQHQRSGLCFERERPDQLAALLSALPNKPQHWQTLASAGQQAAQQHFDIERSVDQLEMIYQRLLQRN